MPTFDFSTPASNGWGSAWTLMTGTASLFNVASGVGTCGPIPANSSHQIGYNPSTYQDPIQTLDFKVNSAPTGADQRIGLCSRSASLNTSGVNNGYRCILFENTAGTFTLQLQKVVGGAATVLAAMNPTLAIGSFWTMYFVTVGNSLRVYLVQQGVARPATWNLSINDTTYTAAGYGSVRFSATTGNTNTPTFTVDNYSINASPAYTTSQPSLPTPGTNARPFPGININPTDFSLDQEAAAQAFLTKQSLVGGGFKLVNIFYDWTNPANNGMALVNFAVEQGLIPIVSWPGAGKPGDWITGTLAGSYDSVYQQFANELLSAGGQVIWRFGWEMNATTGARSINPASTFLSLWNYVTPLVKNIATNTQSFWCPGRFPNDAAPFYPTSPAPDIVGTDVYAQSQPGLIADLLTNRNGNYYSELAAHGKPMILGEVGCREQGDSSFSLSGESAQTFTKAAWMDDAAAQLPANFSQIVGWSWYDELQSVAGGGLGQDWEFETQPSMYGVLSNDPGVNPTVAAFIAWVSGFGGWGAPHEAQTVLGQVSDDGTRNLGVATTDGTTNLAEALWRR